MIITFNELRRIKDKLPSGSSQRIADELGIDVETVRNYFGGKHLDAKQGGLACQHAARIADAGRARIGHHRHIKLLLEHPLRQGGRAVLLVMLMVGHRRRINAKVV